MRQKNVESWGKGKRVMLASVVALGAVAYIVALSVIYQKNTSARIRARISVLSVWFLAILLWPLVWGCVLGERRQQTRALPGLIWPLVILMVDIAAMNHTTYESTTQSKRTVMTMDANAMCSLTFALSGILGAQKDECCRDIFMYAIIGCIAFVLPAPHTSTNGAETLVVETIQKAILAYATGLLLTGIMLLHGKEATTSDA